MWRVYALLAALAAARLAPRARADDTAQERPHIILIVADDLGWNDVGFHGMNHIPTPNIDALAASGLALHNHYVTPLCTPSRAALLTGRYPIHTGMQHGVLYGMSARGLPLSERVLPQHLRALGYRTHLVGKWHLGSCSKEYLPLHRGFESHLGFWTGKIDMFDHTNVEQGSWGFDFRRDFETAHDLFGKYATDVYTDEAIRVIEAHNASSPLFLMVAHSAVHSGNPYEPIRAPPALIDQFEHINDTQRRRFAGVLSKLDESVGRVVEALDARGLLARSVVLFSTDNGGPPAGFNDNAASNYPLRGTKNTVWEGGVRGAAVLWSPLLRAPPGTPRDPPGAPRAPRVARQRAHLVDWLPTLLTAAGASSQELESWSLDGVSLWAALAADGESPRGAAPTLLHLDAAPHARAAALLHDDWKLLLGTTYGGKWDGWYGPAGREGGYDARLVLASRAARAIARLGLMPSADEILRLRSEGTVSCDSELPEIPCLPLRAPCLFNIAQDPCERRNLADLHPEKLEELLSSLAAFNRSAVPAGDDTLDRAGDPARWGRLYTNYRDYLPPVPPHTAPATHATLCV